MKERDFLNWVIELATRTEWMVKHVPAPMVASRRGGFVGAKQAAGLPDLIMVCDDPPRLILAEIKGDGGSLSEPQRDFLRHVQAVANVAVDRNEIDARPDSIADFTWSETPVVGVYAWWPRDRPVVETILTTKVLL